VQRAHVAVLVDHNLVVDVLVDVLALEQVDRLALLHHVVLQVGQPLADLLLLKIATGLDLLQVVKFKSTLQSRRLLNTVVNRRTLPTTDTVEDDVLVTQFEVYQVEPGGHAGEGQLAFWKPTTHTLCN
jgi:hypothetical protein